jgi:hypothetical protein
MEIEREHSEFVGCRHERKDEFRNPRERDSGNADLFGDC